MLKLMKLEIKKYKKKGNLKGIIIANLIILAFVGLSIFEKKPNDNQMIFDNWNDIFLYTSTFVRVAFTIFAGVLISRLIISEYKNKTINILFTYPINRKKVMITKLFIIAAFAFITMILSNIFISSILYLLNIFINFTSEALTMEILVQNSINIFVYSLLYAFISLIPVYIGILRKSGTSVIVTSVILITVLNSHTLSSIIITPIIFAILGLISSYLFIKDIEKIDVPNF